MNIYIKITRFGDKLIVFVLILMLYIQRFALPILWPKNAEYSSTIIIDFRIRTWKLKWPKNSLIYCIHFFTTNYQMFLKLSNYWFHHRWFWFHRTYICNIMVMLYRKKIEIITDKYVVKFRQQASYCKVFDKKWEFLFIIAIIFYDI